MTGVAWGEHSKKILRLLLKLGYHHLKVDMTIIDENLSFAPNPVIKNLNSIILIGSDQIKPYWQRMMFRQYSQLILWIISKDTAYRDVFFWILNEILKKSDEIQKMIKPYVKPPSEWIPNLWYDGVQTTKKLKKKGELPDDVHSFEESMFVRKIQKERYKRNMKR